MECLIAIIPADVGMYERDPFAESRFKLINYFCQPAMSSRLLSSISTAEFARVLPLCRPPLGWSETLG